jgi:hypothetical protein
MAVDLQPGGPRSVLLYRLAYEEEQRACPDVDERIEPVCLLYPRSWVEAVDAMPGTKDLDYSFLGSLYRPEVYANRAWVLDFARRRFTARSYLQLSESPPDHHNLGLFDHTGESEGVWVPKEVPWPDRVFFNPHYFQILRRSEFALCPAGDAPWSNRFFEAVMCRAIPIVTDRVHAGRHEREREIGYTMLLADDEHRYDPEVAEENRRLFIEHQTLMTSNENA